nr:MAG TPA: hypothetical protein [Bacteriophage sp.]
MIKLVYLLYLFAAVLGYFFYRENYIKGIFKMLCFILIVLCLRFIQTP